MSAPIPAIQVLSRENYEEQYIVPLPGAYPLPSLGPNSLRVKSSIISLTTNNFSYARIGHLMGWWDIHELPQSIPPEFSDKSKFGRISAWGYGVVVESTTPNIAVGTEVFGYLPIGTLPIDMKVQLDIVPEGQFFEISKHRENVLPIYNRYFITPPSAEKDSELKKSQGYESVFRVLLCTGYIMNRFVLPWNPTEFTHPFHENDGWTLKDATINSNTTILLFSASGKTALSFAYQLKHHRPVGHQPRKIIGIGSSTSKAFTEDTGLFDKVLTYDADSGDIASELGLNTDSKVIICNFGARDGAHDRWASLLRKSSSNVIMLAIGGEVAAHNPGKVTDDFQRRMMLSPGTAFQLNASYVITKGMEILGEKTFWDDFLEAWDTFKRQGYIKNLNLVWGDSMDDVAKGWERLYQGKVGPEEGLVFDI